jgi:two-component system sensor histidine kinase DevS
MDHPLAADLAEILLAAAPDAMLVVDDGGIIRVVNEAATEMFGWSHADLVGRSVDEFVPEGHREAHATLREGYAAKPSRRPMRSGLDLYASRADGSSFPVEISLSPVVLAGESMTIAAVRDVSDAREAMERLTLLRERERLARDLHDMVIQRIFAAGMGIQAVVGLVDSREAEARLNDVTDTLDETIRRLRQAIFELGHLDDGHTLSSHIAALIDDRAEHLGFVPELSVEGALDDVPDYVADQLIATLTESLSNVARHADATSARVTIECADGDVSLVVEDDGGGVPSHPKPRGGLSNMMWRAAELGGTCSIEPKAPSGTRLVWAVPIGAAGSKPGR